MKFMECLGTVPQFMALAPVALYRAIGPELPHGLGEGAVLWALTQLAAQRSGASIRRAGVEGSDEELGDALFDAVIDAPSGVVFSVDTWDESARRIETSDRRIHLAVPELWDELAALEVGTEAATSDAFPFVLTAGERRSFTANTIFREPAWRRKDAAGALRISPADANKLGVEDGGRVRVTTKRGSVEVPVEISDRMQAGHVSLPNGMGTDATDDTGALVRSGVALNELTASEDRDPFAGTPWHKHVPARVEAL